MIIPYTVCTNLSTSCVCVCAHAKGTQGSGEQIFILPYIHSSSLAKLKCSLNLEADCYAFQRHQVEFILPEGHFNATAKSYPIAVNKCNYGHF